jgi:hypothetical protein
MRYLGGSSDGEGCGTHNGEFLGVPATGRPVHVWGIVIDRLEDGRIKDTRIIMDAIGLMAQLGCGSEANEVSVSGNLK